MVGRGGRSKGCDSCRQRHLKCDQTYPHCQRCQRDHFECRYPAPKFINVFQEQKPPAQKCSLVKKPRITGFNDATVVTYLKNTVFATDADNPEWPGFRALNQTHTKLSMNCLLALSESYFGQTQNAQHMSKRGQQSYIACLRTMNESLGKRKPEVTGDMLLAVTIMHSYETLFATSDSGWVGHGLGLAHLFYLAGPDAFEDKICFHVFVNMRFVMYLSALVKGVPTFLSAPEWKTRPWAVQGVPKNDMDRLQDIVCELPGLRCMMSDPAASDHNSRHSAFTMALSILDRLREWLRAWQQRFMPIVSAVSPSSPGEDRPPWTTELHFENLYSCNCFALYNTTVIFATQAAVLSAGPGDLQPGDAAVLLGAARQAGLDICRSVDYALFHTEGLMGRLTILVPMEKAYEIVGKGTSPEGRWLEQRQAQLRAAKGAWQVTRQILVRKDSADTRVPYLE